MPETRGRTSGRTIGLAVAIFRSRAAGRSADPVVFLTGGPGGAGVVLARALYPTLVAPFLAQRDFVVLDPRGTGWSQPSLTCRPGEEAVACLGRWRRAGVDLAAYRSAPAVDDVEDLRRALGVRRWNVIGLSYGTRLALTLLRDHPGHVRSAILDSVVPPQVDEIASTSRNAAEGIQRLLDACTADPACRGAYPNLPAALREAVERLEREPLVLADGSHLDGGGLLQSLFDALYDAPNLPLLPRAIEAARAGRADPLWARVARTRAQIGSILARAAHLAWVCNEEVPFTTPARVGAVDSRYAPVAWVFSPHGLFDVCRAAGLPRPAPVENRAVTSAVPTLLLTGRFDPVSPVEWAHAAARTLSRGRVVVFPTLAHGVLGQSACARRIAVGFLAAPGRAPVSGCVARMPAIAWAPPG